MVDVTIFEHANSEGGSQVLALAKGRFPENEVEIFPNYVSDDLNALMGRMRKALSHTDISITGEIIEPNATLVGQIRSARHRLSQFLNHPAFEATRKALRDTAPDPEVSIGKLLSRLDFGGAQGEIEKLLSWPVFRV